MKTKYIKVSVADRLPEKSGTYYSEIGEVFFAQSSGKFEHNYEAYNVFPEFWLSPVPDREEEMKGLLREIYPLLMERHLYESGQKIQKILNEIYLTN